MQLDIRKNFCASFFVVAIKFKNQFFIYLDLLRDLLHRQDLTNKRFERRLKCMAMFLSIFLKTYSPMLSPGCFYCSNSRGNFEMTVDVSVINNINNISCIWATSSVWRFVKAAFIENLKSYRSVTTTSTSYSRKLERSFAEISSATFENLSNLL